MSAEIAPALARAVEPSRYGWSARWGRALGYWVLTAVAVVGCGLFSRRRRVNFRRLPRGPYILACNHFSHFDFLGPVTMGWRKLEVVTAADLYQHPIVRWLLTMADTVPIPRTHSDSLWLRVGLDRLARGRILCMFPEGGIRTGATSVFGGAELKPGAAAIAQASGLPILPLMLLGGDQWYEWRHWWGRAHGLLLLGEPLHARTDLPPREAREELNARLADALRELYARIVAEPDVTPEMLPRTAQERWGTA